MKYTARGIVFLVIVAFASIATSAQSTNQNFPTPVTSPEISGTIKARDVGDARLTTYFYQFDGTQGDLFINVVTRNFTGDIDVFTQAGLRPLTKIVVYADLAETETGRVIYLRKPEKMILRVQGRTPGDDPASFRVKFAGSFVASTLTEPAAEPELPSLTAKNESGIRVNSVGTIVEVIPKATPTPAAVAAVPEERAAVDETEKPKPTEPAVVTDAPTETPEKKVEVVVTDPTATIAETKPATPPARTGRGRRRTPPARNTPPAETTTTEPQPPASTTAPPARRTRRTRPPATTSTEPAQPDPLEKVNLVIVFKDGSKIERPMSEVLRFTVDKGVLTVIGKDGNIGRYSILDVAKVTIE